MSDSRSSTCFSLLIGAGVSWHPAGREGTGAELGKVMGNLVLDSYLAQLASLGGGDRQASLRELPQVLQPGHWTTGGIKYQILNCKDRL